MEYTSLYGERPLPAYSTFFSNEDNIAGLMEGFLNG